VDKDLKLVDMGTGRSGRLGGEGTVTRWVGGSHAGGGGGGGGVGVGVGGVGGWGLGATLEIGSQ